MFTLIVVDDEEIVRDGFCQFIDWNSMGFKLIDCFSDGKEAIDFLSTNHVDVVLTDIDMVEVNGLKLSKYIYQHCPATQTVLVSGHKDFEYAKQAMEYGVKRYLIKPTELSEIREVFGKIKNELNETQQEQKKLEQIKKKYEDVFPLLEEQFLLYITTGSIKNEQGLRTRMEAINLPDDLAHNQCCFIDIEIGMPENYSTFNMNYLQNRLQRFFQENRSGLYYISTIHGEFHLRVLVLTYSGHEQTITTHLERDLSRINKTMEQNFGIILTFDRSTIFSHLIELSKNMKMSTANDIKFMTETSTVIGIGEYRQFVRRYEKIVPLVLTGNHHSIKENLNTIFEKFESLPIHDIQRLMVDFFAMITHAFVEKGINVFELNHGEFSYLSILSKTSVEEIKECSLSYLNQLTKLYSSNKMDPSKNLIIDKAKEYIHYHFVKDISLEEVAAHVYLNHAYFSRIFKQHTGINFSDYLTSVRVQRAIELLKENKYKTYEISEMVGYKSSKYFSRVFKQVTGFAPKEYLLH